MIFGWYVITLEYINLRKVCQFTTLDTSCVIPTFTVGTFEKLWSTILITCNNTADTTCADTTYALIIFNAPTTDAYL